MFLGDGGICSFFGNIRPSGGAASKRQASGLIPILKIVESMILAISQGLRCGASAACLPISHPEIEEFIDLRRPAPVEETLNVERFISITV